MFDDLKNKWVLVTGGSRGIGRAIVECLMAHGAKVAFTYQREEAAAHQVLAAARDCGRDCRAYPIDISQASACQALVERIESECGEIYGLVNNAGITRDRSFLMMSTDEWDRVVQVNLNGTAYMTHFMLDRMIRRQQGKIINMSSVSGLRGSPGQANYASTKAALVALTQTLSLEVARYGIQVNAVAPGFIETEMVAAMPEKVREQLHKRIPLRRLGRVSEVANLVLFLLSTNGDYITGQTLVIDGGLSA